MWERYGVLVAESNTIMLHILLCQKSDLNFIVAGSFRVNLVINWGFSQGFGTGWRGAFGIFMISRPISQWSDWRQFRIWNEVMRS